MQQDAGPAGAEHDFHFAGRGGDGPELQNCAPRRLARQALRAFRPNELVQPRPSAAARGTFGRGRVLFGNDEDVEPAKGLGIAGEGAVGGGNQDAPQFLGVAGTDLHDAGVEGPGGAVGAENQLQARGQVQVVAAQGNGVEVGGGGLGEPLDSLFRWPGGNQGRRAGGVQQPVGIEIVGIGVAGALAREHANAAAGAGALAGGFHDLLVDPQRGGRHRLEVEVGVVASGGQGLAQAALQEALGDAEFLKKIALVAGAGGNGRYAHRDSQFTLISGRNLARKGQSRTRSCLDSESRIALSLQPLPC